MTMMQPHHADALPKHDADAYPSGNASGDATNGRTHARTYLDGVTTTGNRSTYASRAGGQSDFTDEEIIHEHVPHVYVVYWPDVVNALSGVYLDDGIAIWLGAANRLLSGERGIDVCAGRRKVANG